MATDISFLLEKIDGQKLSAEEFKALVEACMENQLQAAAVPYKFGWMLRKTVAGKNTLHMFKDRATAESWEEEPTEKNAPLVSVDLPSSGGGGTYSYVVKLETNSAQDIETSNRNQSVNIRFTSVVYNSIDGTITDTGEDATVEIQRQVAGSSEWETVALLNNFASVAANTGAYTQIDMSNYLVNGEQTLRFIAYGSVSELATTYLTFNVQVAEMEVGFTTNWGQAFVYNEDVNLTHTMLIPLRITGNVHKILYWEMYNANDTKVDEGSIEIGSGEYTETSYQGLSIDHPQEVGIYKVRVRLRYGNSSVYTEWIEQYIMVSVKDDTTVLLCVNNVDINVYNWSSQHMMDYAVYNPNTLTTSTVKFEIKDNDEAITWMTDSNANVANGVIYDYTPYLSIENSTPSGRVRLFAAKVKVSVDNVLMRTLTYSIDNSNDFAPTSGANFILMPGSRSNNDADREMIHNESSVSGEPSTIQAVWDKVVFEDDGWVTEDGVKVLKILAGSKVTIPYESYSNTSQTNGLTIEIDLKSKNISNEDTPMFKMGKEINGNFVGLILYPKRGYFFKSTNNVEWFQDIEWGENRRTHITVNIIPNLTIGGRTLNLVRMMVNSNINREFTYQLNERFWDGVTSGGIQIGCTDADILIYGLRIYKEKTLSSSDVFNDRVSAESDVAKKLALIEANNIMEGGVIKYNLAKDKYNTLLWKGVYPSKLNQVETTGDLVVNQIGIPASSGTLYGMNCKGQGTSSKRYLYWNATWSFGDNGVWVDGNGNRKGKYYQITPTSPKAKKNVGKLNWASCMQSHKEGFCDMYNVLYNAIFDGSAGFEPSGIRSIEGYENTKIAVEEKPFLLFVQEDPNSEPVFYGNMTFGSAKGDAPTFGYDKNHPVLKDYLMIEGSDQTPVLGLCQVPWFEDEVLPQYDDEGKIEGWQYNGTLSFDLTLGNAASISHFIDAFNQCFYYSTRIRYYNGRLDDLQTDASADKSYQYFIVGQTYDNFYVYRYDWITSRWVNAGITKTNGNPDAVNVNTQLGLNLDPSSADFDGMLATVKAARIAAFRAIASNYFHVNDTLYGMQFNKINALSDNRNKNTYPYYDPVAGVIRFGSDDNDTGLQNNNQGQKQKQYWVEEHDFDSRPIFNSYYWAASGNAMYNLFEDAYPTELRTMMRKIMTKMADLGVGYGEGGIMGFYEKYLFSIQRYFPTVAYNECARLWYEYAKTLYDAGIYTNDTDPITQSMGDLLECEIEWVRQRIVYIASYCMYDAAMGGSIEFRQLNSATYTLTPAMKMYIYMELGTSYRFPAGYSVPKRCEAGEQVSIICEGGDSIQTYIVGAEYLQDLGDLSSVGVTGSTAFSNGKRLRSLKLGSVNAQAVNFKPSAIASFPPNTEEIDLRNTAVPSIGSLAGVTKLERFYCGGTAILSLTLPQTNLMTDVELNEQLQTLVLRNQTGINHFVFTPTALRSLTSGRCNVIDQQFIENWLDGLSGDLSGYELVIDGIRWTNFSEDKLLKLLQFGTCVLQGTIAMNSLNPSTKVALMNMYGNIDDENNNLYVTYPNGVSISGDKSVIRGGAGDVTITVSIIKYVSDAQITVNQSGSFFTLVSEGEIQYDPITGSATKQYVFHTETLMGTNTNFSAQATIDGITYTSRNFNVAGTARITITSAVIKKKINNVLVDGDYYYTEDKAAANNEFHIVPNTTDGRNAFVDDQGNPIPTDTYRIEWGISDLPSSLDECYLEYEGIGDNEITKVMKQNAGGIGVEICRIPKYPNPANKAQWWNNLTFSNYVNEVDTERLGNDPDFKIVANLVITNRTAATVQTSLCSIVGHPEFFAVQAYDPTKPNYNPAVCIILEQGGLLDRTQLYADGGNMYIDPVTGNQGLVMTMDEAAAVVEEFWLKTRNSGMIGGVFGQKTIVTPTNITDCYEQAESYKFEYFLELRYFKNLKWDAKGRSDLIGGFFRDCSLLKDIRMPKGVKEMSFNNDNPGWGPCGHFANCTSLQCSVNEFKDLEVTFNWNNSNMNRDLNNVNQGQFGNCSSLNWEILPVKLREVGYSTFVGCTNINIHELPSTLTHAYGSIPGDWDYVPDTVVAMGNQKHNTSTNISLPNTVNINNFSGIQCATLKNLTFRLNGEHPAFTSILDFDGCNLSETELYLMFQNTVTIANTKTNFRNTKIKTLIANKLAVSSAYFMQGASGVKLLKLINSSWNGAQQFNVDIIVLDNITLSSTMLSYRAQCNYVFITNTTPPTSPVISGAINVTPKIYVPTGTLAAYQAASGWSNVASYLREYDYETDAAHVLTCTKYDDIDKTKIPD